MTVGDLPDDIFHLIVCFATNDYRELLKYGSVCRDWKESVDSSIAWKMFDLQFVPRRLTDYDQNYADSLTVQGFHISELENLECIQYRKNVSNVVVYNVRSGISDNSEAVVTTLQLPEESRVIRNRFMGLMKAYRRKWQQYRHYVFIHALFKTHVDKLLLVGGILSLLIAFIAWRNFSILFEECTHQCSTQIVDGRLRFFRSMYGVLGIFMIGCLGCLLNEFTVDMLSTNHPFGHEQIDYPHLIALMAPLVLILGWWGSLGLLQSKWNDGWARELSYQGIIYPQWVASGISIIFPAWKLSKHSLEKFIVYLLLSGVLIAGLPLSLSMAASYHDTNPQDTTTNGSSLYLALLPILLHWLLITFYHVKILVDNSILYTRVAFGDETHSFHYLLLRAIVGYINYLSSIRVVRGIILVANHYTEDGWYDTTISPKDYWLPLSDIFMFLLVLASSVLLKSRLLLSLQQRNPFA